MNATVILFGMMFLLMLLGVPIGFSLTLSIFGTMAVTPAITGTFLAQSFYSKIGLFSLLCLPFFIIAGNIMDTGGISKRIVKFANSLVGNVPGGLGIVTILACMFFGAVSGSAPATVAAVGMIMIPEMIRAGYDKYYAVGLVTVAGGLGVVVPPSYPMVVYGCAFNVSISDLFLAGIGPAVMVALLLIVMNEIWALRYGYKGTGEKFSIRNVLKTLWYAKYALLMPVIILGGIYSGIFTATEASVVACVYGIFVGVFIYKEVTWKQIWETYKNTVPTLGGMLLTFAPAGALSSVFVYLGIPAAISAWFASNVSSHLVAVLLMILIMLLTGMFVQTTPCVVILGPMLMPVCASFGITDIQFGMIMLLALCVAFVTPPVAANLFIASSMTGLDMMKITRRSIPFLGMLLLALFLIFMFPSLGSFTLDIFR